MLRSHVRDSRARAPRFGNMEMVGKHEKSSSDRITNYRHHVGVGRMVTRRQEKGIEYKKLFQKVLL